MKDFSTLTPEQRLERSKKIDEFIRQKIVEMSGVENVRGIQVSNIIRRVANLYEVIGNQVGNDETLSGPRLGILFRLYGGEVLHGESGVTPTMLSHMQNVTKNTISSLVKGLEEQGLIRREIDPVDRRIYRLYLTDAGRSYIIKTAPSHINFLNSLTEDLTSQEIDQLMELLGKLQNSLLGRAKLKPFHGHRPIPDIVNSDEESKDLEN
ncbi:MAG: MarR family winged helix-turn-helix transcriptional regulator [Anaerolineaceae bacterium]|nr:MarR family winged helix-turn-helix transcriptional regulator [Anaerolineaceae bacterium]